MPIGWWVTFELHHTLFDRPLFYTPSYKVSNLMHKNSVDHFQTSRRKCC